MTTRVALGWFPCVPLAACRTLDVMDNHTITDERIELLAAMVGLDGASPIELAKLIGKSQGSVRWLLKSMRERGETVKIDGRYFEPAYV
jgi:hypothetical protein